MYIINEFLIGKLKYSYSNVNLSQTSNAPFSHQIFKLKIQQISFCLNFHISLSTSIQYLFIFSDFFSFPHSLVNGKEVDSRFDLTRLDYTFSTQSEEEKRNPYVIYIYILCIMLLNSQIHISNLDLVLNILLGHRHASPANVVASYISISTIKWKREQTERKTYINILQGCGVRFL